MTDNCNKRTERGKVMKGMMHKNRHIIDKQGHPLTLEDPEKYVEKNKIYE